MSSSRWLLSRVLPGVVLALICAASNPVGLHRRTVHEGLAVDLFVEPIKPGSALVRYGDAVKVRFRITESATNSSVRQGRPAAWLDLRPPGEVRTSEGCVAKLKGFLEGAANTPGQDLNVYYVVTLNADKTLSVVDPLAGFRGSRLIALVSLRSVGYDWALSGDRRTLFVSMPDSNQVAVIDTLSWEVTVNIDVAVRPRTLALQPDGHYLWVESEASAPDADDSGVTVIATSTGRVAGRIVTGRGSHSIAFSGDSRYAFAGNSADGTVTVIDVGSLRKLKDVKTGPQPISIAWSAKAGMLYVAHRGDGSIAAVDPGREDVIARDVTKPGLGSIRFAPGGRLGFAVHTERKEVYIFDTATNRVVQIADTEKQPDQVSFSDSHAYIRHQGSDQVLMIALADLGQPGKRVQAADFPGGKNPPGHMSNFTPADGIVPAPGGNAVLIANPLDKSVYFYKQGMAAPMGTFSNYGREPRAVMAVDRSLRETPEGGVYETATTLGKPGMYDLVFLLDSPRFIHCFEVPVAPNPDLNAGDGRGSIEVQFDVTQRTFPTGGEVRLRFRLFDSAAGKLRSGLRDVSILVYRAPGTWRGHFTAQETEQAGVYSASLTLPQAGVHYVHVGSPSLKLGFSDARYLAIEVRDPVNSNTK